MLFPKYKSAIEAVDPAALNTIPAIPDAFLMHEHKEQKLWQEFYIPLEFVNENAKICFVTVSPDFNDWKKAVIACRKALTEGRNDDEALRLAKAATVYSGVMRFNLVNLLNYIGINKKLGIKTCDLLFEPNCTLAHATSVFVNPVMVDGESLSSLNGLKRSQFLQDAVMKGFAEEVKKLPNAVFIPLGKAVDGLDFLVERGILESKRILIGLPHAAGTNIARIEYFLGIRSREEMRGRNNADIIDANKERLLLSLKDVRFAEKETGSGSSEGSLKAGHTSNKTAALSAAQNPTDNAIPLEKSPMTNTNLNMNNPSNPSNPSNRLILIREPSARNSVTHWALRQQGLVSGPYRYQWNKAPKDSDRCTPPRSTESLAEIVGVLFSGGTVRFFPAENSDVSDFSDISDVSVVSFVSSAPAIANLLAAEGHTVEALLIDGVKVRGELPVAKKIAGPGREPSIEAYEEIGSEVLRQVAAHREAKMPFDPAALRKIYQKFGLENSEGDASGSEEKETEKTAAPQRKHRHSLVLVRHASVRNSVTHWVLRRKSDVNGLFRYQWQKAPKETGRCTPARTTDSLAEILGVLFSGGTVRFFPAESSAPGIANLLAAEGRTVEALLIDGVNVHGELPVAKKIAGPGCEPSIEAYEEIGSEVLRQVAAHREAKTPFNGEALLAIYRKFGLPTE